MIGPIQTNKAKTLISQVPNLFMVETIHSAKLASALEKACVSVGRAPLNVLLQVNSSCEDTKSGVAAADAPALVKHIISQCPHLVFRGFMTIGSPSTPETDFKTLIECRAVAARENSLDEQSLELSMGMSSDMEIAVRMGSTNVRVGSTIFGARDYAH
eukprot:TRINITY_DN7709_c1_g1_i1.p1 TRINITY_DN7709_c1_g1~~TRINITY_DN7709_c1_g1_i1.p1  ORF type:complete len:158 (+),score=36.02 TRINITY_DN7709_c1_g1_i1:385-858(+)